MCLTFHFIKFTFQFNKICKFNRLRVELICMLNVTSYEVDSSIRLMLYRSSAASAASANASVRINTDAGF